MTPMPLTGLPIRRIFSKDYGADYEDKLLSISAKFVTPENLSELEEAIALFETQWRAQEFRAHSPDDYQAVGGRAGGGHLHRGALRKSAKLPMTSPCIGMICRRRSVFARMRWAAN
jgi:hypothetical protein